MPPRRFTELLWPGLSLLRNTDFPKQYPFAHGKGPTVTWVLGWSRAASDLLLRNLAFVRRPMDHISRAQSHRGRDGWRTLRGVVVVQDNDVILNLSFTISLLH